MPYATQDRMQELAGGAERFLALTDFDGDGAIDASVVSGAMSAADSWIDGFIPQRYQAQQFTPSPAIVELASREAIYRIKCDRMTPSQVEIDDHKAREFHLREVRAGRVRPDVVAVEKNSPVRPGVVKLTGGRMKHIDRWGDG